MLKIPKAHTSLGRSSFQFAAAGDWNELQATLKLDSFISISSFSLNHGHSYWQLRLLRVMYCRLYLLGLCAVFRHVCTMFVLLPCCVATVLLSCCVATMLCCHVLLQCCVVLENKIYLSINLLVQLTCFIIIICLYSHCCLPLIVFLSLNRSRWPLWALSLHWSLRKITNPMLFFTISGWSLIRSALNDRQTNARSTFGAMCSNLNPNS
jgi:hypothetical protein